MKNIIKTFSLLSIISVIPGAFGATSRVSMISKTSPRLPSIAGYITASTGTTTTSTTAYLADVDCIDNYTACIKNNDTCGSDFEECTNSILLHAKMPTCLNVLSQCSTAGRASLFGTSDLNAIATYVTKNSEGEVTAYTYPTSSSVLGQMITAAQIENRLDTNQCERDRLIYGKHEDNGIYMLRQFFALTYEEELAIKYHMGDTNSDEPFASTMTYGAYKISPLALFLHLSDMMAICIDEKEIVEESPSEETKEDEQNNESTDRTADKKVPF